MASHNDGLETPRRPGRPVGARVGETREALLEAAHEVMAERGYPRVTIREIAERAGVQSGLVHYYFGGKEGLLRAVVERVAGEMRAAILPAARGAPEPEALRRLIRGVVQAIMTAPYGPRLMVEQVLFGDTAVIDEFVEQFSRPNLVDIRALLEEGHASGALRPVDTRFLVPALFGACVFFFLSSPIQQRLFEMDEIDEELAREFAEHTADLFLYGIAATDGKAP